MDKQKLNTIYNQLKELVGEQGAFVFFAVGGDGKAGEDIQVRGYGPITGQHGLLGVGGQLYQEHMSDKISKMSQILPNEPD